MNKGLPDIHFVSARFLVSLRTIGCLLNIFLFTTQCCAYCDKRPWIWTHYKYSFLWIYFLWIYHTCHAYVLQMWKKFAQVLHRSEGFACICHTCEKNRTSSSLGDKYVRIFHTCDRFVWLSHSNISVTRVKNSHVLVTHVKNSNEFFTYVTNTCEFFTRLKLDICEKLVPIKISKLVVRIFHIYQNVTYSCE